MKLFEQWTIELNEYQFNNFLKELFWLGVNKHYQI